MLVSDPCLDHLTGQVPELIDHGEPLGHGLGAQISATWSSMISRLRKRGSMKVLPRFVPCPSCILTSDDGNVFPRAMASASDSAHQSDRQRSLRGPLNRGCRIEGRHHLARAEPQGPAQAVAELGCRIDSEGMVDRRGQVGRPERLGDRISPQAVGLADHLSPDHPASGEDRREDRRPVVAAGDIPGLQLGDPGRSPELAEHDNQRLVQQDHGS